MQDSEALFLQAVRCGCLSQARSYLPLPQKITVTFYRQLVTVANNFNYLVINEVLLDSRTNLAEDPKLMVRMFVDAYGHNRGKLTDIYQQLRSRTTDQDIHLITDSDYHPLSPSHLSSPSSPPRLLLPIGKISDPLRLMKMGYFPKIDKAVAGSGDDDKAVAGSGDDDNNCLLADALTAYVNGVEWKDMCLLYSEATARLIHNLSIHPVWCYYPISTYQHQATITCWSLPLILQGGDVYSSLRPVTNMSRFLPDNYITYMRGAQPPSLPVTRYAGGMSRGLFCDEPTDGKTYKGTFYYLEPESTTYLQYTKCRYFFNKWSAYEALCRDCPMSENKSAAMQDFMSGELPDDLMMTSEEITRYLGRETVSVSDRKFYAGQALGLYAEEDVLDQILCTLAEVAGLDVLVFTHVPGSHQVVTELVDVRDRKASFGQLIQVV
jgi:hypothetical protein